MLAVVGLALLAVPRVVLHDLGLIHEGTAVNALLVAVPPVVWIATALLARVPRPLLTLLAVGLVHAVLLAAVHQLLWTQSFPDGPPRLGGNLADLAPGVQAVLLRGAATASSLVVGTLVGVLCGLVAEGLKLLLGRRIT